MDGSQIVSVVSVIASPISALVGVWMTANLTARSRIREQQETTRADSLSGLARFMALTLDADPTLITSGQLREYSTPEEAVAGLYKRWVEAREPLVRMAFSHPSKSVRDLALRLQADLEMVLRSADNQIKSGLQEPPRALDNKHYQNCLTMGAQLGQLLEQGVSAQKRLPSVVGVLVEPSRDSRRPTRPCAPTEIRNSPNRPVGSAHE